MSTSTIGECAGGRLPQVYPKDDWQELAWDRQMSEWFGSVCVMSFNVGPQTSTRVDKCVHRTLLVSTLKKQNLSKPMTIQSSVKTEGTTVTQLMWFHSCYIHTLLSFIPSNLTFSYLFPLPTPFSSFLPPSFLQIFFVFTPSFLPPLSLLPISLSFHPTLT